MSGYIRPVKQKQPRIISKKITDSAEGEECTLRIPGVCNYDPRTTVFAHMNGGGMGYKHHDIHGCYACSDCHDWLDKKPSSRGFGTASAERFADRKMAEFNRAMIETQKILIDKGLLKV